MFRGLSLARKCQILFGAAVVLIISAALFFPWFSVAGVIDGEEIDACRQLAVEWSMGRVGGDGRTRPTPEAMGLGDAELQRRATFDYILPDRFERPGGEFAQAAIRRFSDPDNARTEYHEVLRDKGDRVYRYARAIRHPATGELAAVVTVERRSRQAANRLLAQQLLLIGAGLVAGALAVLAFYLITTRIILSPVRALRRTAERVREGDLAIRSEINTGDEFEELATAFNEMLSTIATAQDQMRSSNLSLDLRVNELARANVALNEANRLKGEFLANISHELRTPLNSIIGFAELLQDIAEKDSAAVEELSPEARARTAKRARFLENIVVAGRNLLEMINDLLEMAKIEAGRIEVRLEPMNVAEACDGLLALIRPQAERKSVRLSLELPGSLSMLGDAQAPAGPAPAGAPAGAFGLPVITTDPRKFQQVIFNFLSNAVKFTPEGGSVTLRAESLVASDGRPSVRVSVLDTGPGIADEDQKVIFEKFRQLESGHTRSQAGTGLGLAIARDLATVLQGEIQLLSAPGSGSMFSLIVPVEIDPARATNLVLRMAGKANAQSDGDDQPARARDIL